MSVFRDMLDKLKSRFFETCDIPTVLEKNPRVRVEFSCDLGLYSHAQDDPATWNAVIYVSGGPLETTSGEVVYGSGKNGEEAFKDLMRKLPEPSS